MDAILLVCILCKYSKQEDIVNFFKMVKTNGRCWGAGGGEGHAIVYVFKTSQVYMFY